MAKENWTGESRFCLTRTDKRRKTADPEKKRTKSVSGWQNRHLQGSCSLQAKAAQFPVRHMRLTLKIPARTHDPPLTAGDWQLRPFSPSPTQGKKLFQLQIKIKVIFFFKKRLQQFVNFLKSGFIFTGITHWGQFYFVKCSQIKLFSNFYFVTKSSWENCL